MTNRIVSILAAVIAVTGPSVPTPSPSLPSIEPGRATAVVEVSGIPSTVPMQDLMGTALATHLDEPLDVSTIEPAQRYLAGDIGYWGDEQRLFVFLTSGSALPDSEVVIVGRLRTPLGALDGCSRDCRVEFVVAASG